MGVLLLFYLVVLSKEKIYQINRWYLLFGLLLSLIIPLIPIGITNSILNLDNNTEIHQIVSHSNVNTNSKSIAQVPANSKEKNKVEQTSNANWIYSILIWLYSIIAVFLSLRLIRHLYLMKLRSLKNQSTFFKGHKVVLLDEEAIPHTFMKTIFVNKEQYENGKIGEEVMIHEITHAEQNHSLDIIIVEILKTIGWFNPVLYFYKIAIQLNHEYIADDKVLSKGIDIADYQRLLLHIRTAKSAHYLSTSLNFRITKKRLKMMTIKDSTYRSYLKTALILPFILILGFTFGCKPDSMQKNNQTKDINLELADSGTIKLNGKIVSASNFQSAFSDLSIDPKTTIINLKVQKNTSMGLIVDVQKILREHGPLKVNYSTLQSKSNQSMKIQSLNLDTRNILNLYIDEKGDIFINQEHTSLSSVKRLVREFITNNGRSTGLSERPKDAIIAIKTDKKTPYNTYNSTFQKVKEVYNELRNKASMNLFNKPFQSLKEGSQERIQIKNMYPMKISIKEPSNGSPQ